MDKFKIVKYPPAKSKVYLRRSLIYYITSYFTSKHLTQFEDYFAEKEIIMADSWVKLLSVYLTVIRKNQVEVDEVILPKHSCFEFSKAILSAGLKPVYVDLTSDLDFDFEHLNSKIGSKTIAIIGVTNVGIEINFERLRSIANANNIYLIEDATYSYLGTNRSGKKFGELNDVAILNFSEGKFIPVGGGALLMKKENYDLNKKIRSQISVVRKQGDLSDLTKIIIYIFGSSTIGFSLASILQKLFKRDLKRFFSMEPSRKKNSVPNDFKLSDLSRIRKSVILAILKRYKKDLNIRFQKQQYLISKIESHKVYDYDYDQVVLKVPIILTKISNINLEELNRLGVIKLYSENSPLYPIEKDFPVSKDLYENLFTIPVHAGIGYKTLDKIVNIIDDRK